MDETPSQRAKEIFHEVCELPADERNERLEQLCGGDAELRRLVDELLGHHDLATKGFLDPRKGGKLPDLDPTSFGVDAIRIGSQIGPYRILSVLGEGGFGIVYLAEQKEPIHRRVALKVIKPGMDSRAVLSRFEIERQALALMDHPNVARVLDAGKTSGEMGERPYFVMEFVSGIPITEHCDTHRLTVDERVALMVDVCHAVQHAHQKGIIHRDLKPTNILVTLQGDKSVPKIIDFGVAKAIDRRLTEETVFTEFGQMIGTPEYMSPEQAEMSKQDIDTRTDIYSLGVVLYQLLTGHLPFDSRELRRKAYGEIQRMIREVEPPKPSTRLSTVIEGQPDESQKTASARRVDSKSLSRQVRGDLDWITMKAMEKDRTRRYSTAAELALDLERHLHNEPVIAGPPSATYRFRKFVRRNKALVTGGGAVAAAVLIGLVVSSVLYVRAENQRIRAEAAENEALNQRDAIARFGLAFVDDFFDIEEELRQIEAAEKAREFLIDGAINFFDALDPLATEIPSIKPLLPDAYRRLGEIRGGTRSGNLGDPAGALANYQTAQRTLESLESGQMRADDALIMRASIKLSSGDAHMLLEQPKEAEAAYSDALEACNDFVNRFGRQHAKADDVRRLQSAVRLNLASMMAENGQLEEAERDLVELVSERRQRVTLDNDDMGRRRDLSIALARLADVQMERGLHDRGIANMEESLDLREKLAAVNPDSTRTRRDVANGRVLFGAQLLGQKSYGPAIRQFELALATFEELIAASPEDLRVRLDALRTHRLMIATANLTDDPQLARTHATAAQRSADELFAQRPGSLTATVEFGLIQQVMSVLETRQDETEQALEYASSALDLRLKLVRARSDKQDYLEDAEATIGTIEQIGRNEGVRPRAISILQAVDRTGLPDRVADAVNTAIEHLSSEKTALRDES